MNQRVLLQDAFDRMINASDLEPKKYYRVGDAFGHIVNKLSEQRLSDLLEILSDQYKHFFRVDDTERYREYFIDTARNFLELNSAPEQDVPEKELKEILNWLDSEIAITRMPNLYGYFLSSV